MTLVQEIQTPTEFLSIDTSLLRSLESSLLNFALMQSANQQPMWLLSNSKIFRADSTQFELAACYMALKGHYAAVNTSMAGLALVADLSVNCFLKSGRILWLMSSALGMDVERPGTFLTPDQCTRVLKVIKKAKVYLEHIGQYNRVNGLGPPANQSNFVFKKTGEEISVATYYEIRAKTDPKLGSILKKTGGKLMYPNLPTINIGSNTKPTLVPAELLLVTAGQSRSQVNQNYLSTIILIAFL